jgi:outer membrane assembly lipoprotein YfiO
MPRTGWALVAILAAASSSALPTSSSSAEEIAALAPKTWERNVNDTQWRPVEESTPTAAADQVVANAELDGIERLLANKQASKAKPRILKWIQANPAVPDRDRGLFLLAEMYNRTGDKIRAFYHLDELLDYYPESRLFYPALEKQYEIADRFLKGYKRKFLGIPFLTTDDEGVEILFRIQERAPGSPIAERSLLRTADFYYDDSQFDLAADAYAAYARAYPRSPEVPRVRLRQAFSSLAQFRGLRFDATPVIDAKAQLEDIQAEYPQLAQEENVADVLERIDGILAARVAQTADFYRRTGEPQAAVYNWRYVVENFPETAEAERARVQLAKAPKWALELPPPTGGRGAEEEQLRTPPATDLKAGPQRTPALQPQTPIRDLQPEPAKPRSGASDTTPAPSVETPSEPNK